MDKNEVLDLLNSYKRNIMTYKSILNNSEIFIPAQCISDIPKAQYKFNSSVENQVFNNNHEIKELWKDINQVNIWLEYLTEEERFVIEQIYFDKRFISHIVNKWTSLGKEYHSVNYWKTKHRDALKKIISN